MSDFVFALEKILKILHSFTGFFVHPEKGGCCGVPREDPTGIQDKRIDN